MSTDDLSESRCEGGVRADEMSEHLRVSTDDLSDSRCEGGVRVDEMSEQMSEHTRCNDATKL